MISRLSLFATAFAVAATAALVITAQAHATAPVLFAVAPPAKTVRVIELPRVVVIAHRQDRAAP